MKNEIKSNISLQSCKALCQAKYVSSYETVFVCFFLIRLENEDSICLEFRGANTRQ